MKEGKKLFQMNRSPIGYLFFLPAGLAQPQILLLVPRPLLFSGTSSISDSVVYPLPKDSSLLANASAAAYKTAD